jgi:hypothetical protein
MLADLGTKALHAPRLEKLKEPMSMGTIKEEEKEDEVEERKDEEKKEKEMKNWAEAAQFFSQTHHNGCCNLYGESS